MFSCHFSGAGLTPMLRLTMASSPLRVYSSSSFASRSSWISAYGLPKGYVLGWLFDAPGSFTVRPTPKDLTCNRWHRRR